MGDSAAQGITDPSLEPQRRVHRAVSDLGVEGRLKTQVLDDSTAQVAACMAAMRALLEHLPELGAFGVTGTRTGKPTP